MRHPIRLVLIALVLTGAALACGSDEGKRGLTPPPSDEAAVPDSTKALEETEAQRDKQNLQQEEKVEQKDFDQAEQ